VAGAPDRLGHHGGFGAAHGTTLHQGSDLALQHGEQGGAQLRAFGRRRAAMPGRALGVEFLHQEQQAVLVGVRQAPADIGEHEAAQPGEGVLAAGGLARMEDGRLIDILEGEALLALQTEH
jgi:hypothetical protein